MHSASISETLIFFFSCRVQCKPLCFVPYFLSSFILEGRVIFFSFCLTRSGHLPLCCTTEPSRKKGLGRSQNVKPWAIMVHFLSIGSGVGNLARIQGAFHAFSMRAVAGKYERVASKTRYARIGSGFSAGQRRQVLLYSTSMQPELTRFLALMLVSFSCAAPRCHQGK